MNKVLSVKKLLAGQKLVPVVVLENESQALGLAAALLEGGVTVIEITLRNDFGLQAIEVIKENFPDMLILAGTITSAESMLEAVNAGADGIVSPGLTPALLQAAQEHGIAYLPGVATASDVVLAMEYGLSECKLFPATVVGGESALKALGGPFPNIQFCPTGGINGDNYQDFLKLKNVMCVGGSWLCPEQKIIDEDWDTISKLCKIATDAV